MMSPSISQGHAHADAHVAPPAPTSQNAITSGTITVQLIEAFGFKRKGNEGHGTARLVLQVIVMFKS